VSRDDTEAPRKVSTNEGVTRTYTAPPLQWQPVNLWTLVTSCVSDCPDPFGEVLDFL